jgi:hypothetical protein
MALYPDVARDVVEACVQYQRGDIGEEQLQTRLWSASQIISALEDRELSNLFRRTEGQIELLRFTVDAASVRERVLPLVAEVERRTKEYLS